jgi:hypothetical protein
LKTLAASPESQLHVPKIAAGGAASSHKIHRFVTHRQLPTLYLNLLVTHMSRICDTGIALVLCHLHKRSLRRFYLKKKKEEFRVARFILVM